MGAVVGRTMTGPFGRRQQLTRNAILPELQACTILGQAICWGDVLLLMHWGSITPSPSAPLVHCSSLLQHPPLIGGPLTLVTDVPSGRAIPICSSWNAGRCIYPGTCSFRHVCATLWATPQGT